jgi:zeaxanthin glucosyltransferase
MSVAFLTSSAPGHGYPMTTLARRLKGRGHDVVSIGFPSAEPLVRAAELPFVPLSLLEWLIKTTGDRRRFGDESQQ